LKFKDLEKFFETYTPSDEPIKLSEGVVINNQKTFLETHISTLKANTGNTRFEPYYLRLKKYYELINN
jgi:hypothetical protein